MDAALDSHGGSSSVRAGVLELEASSVDIRYMHVDIHNYPVVPVEVRHRGGKHSVKAAINSHLVRPLILGTDVIC